MNYDRAEAVLTRGLALCGRPESLLVHLAAIETGRGNVAASKSLLDEALEKDPNSAKVWNNLGHLYGVTGKMNESLAAFRKAVSLDVSNPVYISNVLLTLNYLPSPKKTVYEAHKLLTAAVQKVPLPAISPDTSSKKIRIGYLSSDFRSHAVAFFFVPIITHHNREKFSVTCYIDNAAQDGVTEFIQSRADQWHSVNGLNDEQLAALIRKDGIDILVDLSGHSNGRRLPLLRSKPAPCQVSYLGYPNTPGMPEIDYRIVDAITDPPVEDDSFFLERLVRIQPPFICYAPSQDIPEVSPLPALRNGYITFGSFNRLEKLTADTVLLWAKVLVAVPRSKLILKIKHIENNEVIDRLVGDFQDAGVESHRLVILPWAPSYVEHLRAYRNIDISLDATVYNGTTTTCESLAMGVPVVAMMGDRHASRVSASILQSMGLDRFVGEDAEAFVKVAEAASGDLEGLASLRKALRTKMFASPLTDAKRLVSELEKAFLAMAQKHGHGVRVPR